MAIKSKTGFTLIEITLVLAISGALFVIIFAGQRQLRARATFDAAVEKVVATINDANNQALAGINATGQGNGERDCSGGATPRRYVFAGVAWSMVDAPAGATFRRDYFAAERATGQACIFNTQYIDIGDHLRTLGANQRRIAFVRDNKGGMEACFSTSSLVALEPTFTAGTCTASATPGGFTATLESVHDSFVAHITVGSNGLASRVD